MSANATAEYLGPSDVARLAGVSVSLVRVWYLEGRLAYIRTAGGMRLSTREDVERLIARRTAARGRREP